MLRFTVPETEGNLAGLWNTLITALSKHQAVSMTCFCISSNWGYWDPQENRDLFHIRVFKWCFPGWSIQKWYGWLLESQRSLVPTLRILNTNLIYFWVPSYFSRKGFSAICTKLRTVSTSKLELALIGDLQPFHDLFRERYSKIQNIVIHLHSVTWIVYMKVSCSLAPPLVFSSFLTRLSESE